LHFSFCPLCSHKQIQIRENPVHFLQAAHIADVTTALQTRLCSFRQRNGENGQDRYCYFDQANKNSMNIYPFSV